MPKYEYNKEYAKKYLGKLDEIKLRVPKGRKADIASHAKRSGYNSVNALMSALLRADMGLSEEEWEEGVKDADH